MSKNPSSSRKSDNPAPSPAAAAGPASVLLQASPYHPALSLFVSQKNAQSVAAERGPTWVPLAFACGYLITDGWQFHDTQGRVSTFCPVPHECLETIQDIVTVVQKSDLVEKYRQVHIKEALRDHPTLAALPPSLFESVCVCTLLRVNHGPYNGDKEDWLTIPAWALRMPKRRMRISR